MEKGYQPRPVEARWQEVWEKQEIYRSEIGEHPPYTLLMPPPNVTGVLHMGHVLNNTLQDILARYHRMKGYNVCWVPGTDHASIATEAKVVARLRQQGIDKWSLGREGFLEQAWAWTHEHGGIIVSQLKRLGVSADWRRYRFTLDPPLYQSVLAVFVKLYQDGLIYRGKRMIHWDPVAQTALSDEEVIYREEESSLYYVRYVAEDGSYLVVATVRPETILADVAVAVHPADERYVSWIGRSVRVPLTERWVPVIADEAVDPSFGTGCLKITPAHDARDYEIGQRHGLPLIEILSPQAVLLPEADKYAGLSREKARWVIAEDLQKAGLLEKVEPYRHNVGHSERTDAVVEPRLSEQWFVRMKPLAELALQAVERGEVQIVPERFLPTYRHWLENVKDWCISRQLWWGHRIPAWYAPDGKCFVALTEEEARQQAQAAGYDPDSLKQDEDVLDTWFSSWLWPLTVFDFFVEPQSPDFQYFYPSAALVTAPEILFFWVARMIMAGYYFAGKKPFSVVYLHGIVRDRLRRKMSKSLGNSPDPIQLMETYGADAVRLGIIMSASAGNDLLFDEALCEQGRNFCNKIWNSFRLLHFWREKAPVEEPSPFHHHAYQWFSARLKRLQKEVSQQLQEYRFYEAAHTLYRGIWEDFCSWYLEALKPAPARSLLEKVEKQALRLLQLLHPFMPHITEELWHEWTGALESRSLSIEPLPEAEELTPAEQTLLQAVAYAQEVVSRLRSLRQEFGLKAAFSLAYSGLKPEDASVVEAWVRHFLPIKSWQRVESPPEASPLRIVVGQAAYYAEVEGDPTKWHSLREKIHKELAHVESFLQQLEQKLQNPAFRAKANPEVIAREEKKYADTQARRALLLEQLQSLHAL
ncbi:MAG: valine--tRNA ligase [Bacteroidia bacterium]|nr:valine--tRNA ligase [Bacteroidia bacterium]MDW8236486.1 valine--tRNA ligase [Bacteroidia bacterium]